MGLGAEWQEKGQEEGVAPLGVASVFSMPSRCQSLLFFVGSTSQVGGVASFLSVAVISTL